VSKSNICPSSAYMQDAETLCYWCASTNEGHYVQKTAFSHMSDVNE